MRPSARTPASRAAACAWLAIASATRSSLYRLARGADVRQHAPRFEARRVEKCIGSECGLLQRFQRARTLELRAPIVGLQHERAVELLDGAARIAAKQQRASEVEADAGVFGQQCRGASQLRETELDLAKFDEREPAQVRGFGVHGFEREHLRVAVHRAAQVAIAVRHPGRLECDGDSALGVSGAGGLARLLALGFAQCGLPCVGVRRRRMDPQWFPRRRQWVAACARWDSFAVPAAKAAFAAPQLVGIAYILRIVSYGRRP